MKDRSDDPSHHERMLLPRSYISLPSINESATLQWNLPKKVVLLNTSPSVCYPAMKPTKESRITEYKSMSLLPCNETFQRKSYYWIQVHQSATLQWNLPKKVVLLNTSPSVCYPAMKPTKESRITEYKSISLLPCNETYQRKSYYWIQVHQSATLQWNLPKKVVLLNTSPSVCYPAMKPMEKKRSGITEYTSWACPLDGNVQRNLQTKEVASFNE